MNQPDLRRDRKNAGFTLVELLVVSVLGALILVASYNVLITNQRAYLVQNVQVVSQQSMRSALEVLGGELREVSARDGDLLSVKPDSVSIRVMRDFGVACQVNTAIITPTILVKKLTGWFAADDSVYVFADNDEASAGDDTWLMAKVTAIDTTGTCDGTDRAQLLSFSGQSVKFLADDVLVGAPVRTFTRYQYRTQVWNSRLYLGRSTPGGSFEPMIGPLRDYTAGYNTTKKGVEFLYYDANGITTAVAADVRRIDIVIRTWSPVTNQDGTNVEDSVSLSVYTRN